MLTMLDKDRRALSAGLLRVLKASEVLTTACQARSDTESEWATAMTANTINSSALWDGNVPFRAVRASIARTLEAAREHGMALFVLARSERALSVPLATVTRGAIEAYGRVFEVLSAEAPETLFARYAALDFFDMHYPARHGQTLRRLSSEVDAVHPVDGYRQRLKSWTASHDLKLVKREPAILATDMLRAIYPDSFEVAVIYSGMSAVAHAQPWATANFLDFSTSGLRRDDKILMEYCMYVIEITRLVADLIAERFGASIADLERWRQ